MSNVDMPQSDINPDFPFWVTIEEDDSITIEWDKSHTVTSIFNSWTEDQFINMFTSFALDIINNATK